MEVQPTRFDDITHTTVWDQHECENGAIILHVTIDDNEYETAHLSAEVDDDGPNEWEESINKVVTNQRRSKSALSESKTRVQWVCTRNG